MVEPDPPPSADDAARDSADHHADYRADYRTVARTLERSYVVKGSSFLAFVAPLGSLSDSDRVLAERRALHPSAGHHAYAYRLGSLARFSDDGEPGGTAGRPMLEVLEKRGLDYVLAVVTRTFGGVKLGAGGLARAYGGSLAKTLDEAGTVLVRARTRLRLELPFAEMDAAHRLLDAWPGLDKGEPAYSAAGLVLEVSLPLDDAEPLRAALADATRGRARVHG